ncbi:MAG: hypothetical protein ACKVJF_11245, partial [Flavobacteriales bacterium]
MKQFYQAAFLCFFLFSFLSTSAQRKSKSTPEVDTSIPKNFYEGLEWRNIGPYRGGRSLGAAGSPGRPYEYYFGATGGGLWKTVDGGTEWFPVTDGQVTSS